MVSIPVASPPLDLVTTALLDLFRGSGRTVYDGVYGGDPVKPTYPYAILYATPGGSGDPFPDLDKRGDEVTAAWQVTAVSSLRNQAQQLQRVCHDLLLARNPDSTFVYPIAVPSGWAISDRTGPPVPGGVTASGDAPVRVFSAPLPFTLTLAPA